MIVEDRVEFTGGRAIFFDNGQIRIERNNGSSEFLNEPEVGVIVDYVTSIED